jgi:hypothetical protein
MLQDTITIPVQNIAETIDRGLEFEKFVQSRFNPAQYRLLDKRSAGLYPLTNKDPQLVYQVQHHHRCFAVECRFRERDYRNKFTWAENFQLEHYERFQEKTRMPLFIVIGIGGLPSKPTNVYVIPFSHISNTTTLELSRFKEYERSNADTGFFFDGAAGKLK